VLIVGGGSVALRKTKGLVESAARVTIVSPTFAEGFDAFSDIERIQAPYAATHMARKMWRLVFAATDVREVNAQVQKHAAAAGILCCRADEPDEGDFSAGAVERIGNTRKSDGRGVNAVANSGGILIAISTAGASPVLAARICKQAAANIDPILPRLANLTAAWRARVKAEIADIVTRRNLLQRLAGEEMEACLRDQGDAAAQRLFAQWLGEALAGTLTPPAVRAKSTRAVEHAD
jgi:precorrin-2 dehydrogenase/sirohydrochlorin ferrochelatase